MTERELYREPLQDKMKKKMKEKQTEVLKIKEIKTRILTARLYVFYNKRGG